MLKREITYTFIDDEDKEVTETGVYYFHLSHEELLEWQSKYKEPLGEALQRIIKSADQEQMFAFFKKVLLDSYGVREDGGRTFFKSEEIKSKFAHSAAYKALFIELSSNEDAAAQFINGIFPKDLIPDKPQPEVVNAVSTVKSP